MMLIRAIGVFTMMWLTVGERVHKIGLLRALGAKRREVQGLSLREAVVLTLFGGAFGVAAGLGIAGLERLVSSSGDLRLDGRLLLPYRTGSYAPSWIDQNSECSWDRR